MMLNGALPATPTPATSASAGNTKPRSCVVCRSRKVRCDKLSPCSNCRRANIECVVPSNDRPPRWARRLERLTAATTDATVSASPSSTSSLLQPSLPTTRARPPPPPPPPPQSTAPGSTQVMKRLRNLESLVKELSDQLEQAHAAAGGTSGPGSLPSEQHASSSTTAVHEDMGRLVLGDTDRPHYITSGFWSRISDELDGLKMDTQRLDTVDSDSSDDEDASPEKTPSLPEVHRTPSDRHAFLFGHNLMGPVPDLSESRPLPSQIPFLLDTFSTNVNLFLQVVHMPTVTKMIRNLREDDMAGPSPSNDALLCSIYYAAVTSMVDEDVAMNFGSPKAELSLKYRLGLERALSKADFMSNPDIVLVQALTIFVSLARSHDSPRFVWMMTGLVIRMAHAIGLQRDGSHFVHLTPFEAEMRRRVWWAVCMLDTRASEDQGTDYTITVGTYDTELPRNINDAAIGPETAQLPQECEGLTDMSVALATHEMCSKARLMSGPEAIPTAASLEAQDRALTTFAANLERLYLRYAADSGSVVGWVAAMGARLVMCKQTLYTYFPVLAGPAGKTISEKLRDRLLVAALELAEYNHALHSEHKARHWRWLFQSYTHWHAIVYLLIECSRRPWSPILERVWIALHSPWLIPKRPSAGVDRKSQVWVPLRQLMSKARRHRREELVRLRGDAKAIEQREAADRRNISVPASPGPFPEGKCEEMLLAHWRSLVHVSAGPGLGESGTSNSSSAGDSIPTPPPPNSAPIQPWSKASFGSKSPDGPSYITEQGLSDIFGYLNPTVAPVDSQGASATGPAASPEWLWADTDLAVEVFGGVDVDMTMDVGADVDWNSWVQSAADMEISARSAGQTAGGSGIERGGW